MRCVAGLLGSPKRNKITFIFITHKPLWHIVSLANLNSFWLAQPKAEEDNYNKKGALVI